MRTQAAQPAAEVNAAAGADPANTTRLLATVLRTFRFRYATEEQLQYAIAQALTAYLQDC